MSSSPRLCASAAVFKRARKDNLRTTIRPTNEANVITPKPPTWMSTRITTCPNPVQYVGVSTTMCPVTQSAETAVKRASMNVAPPVPDFRDLATRASRYPAARLPQSPRTRPAPDGTSTGGRRGASSPTRGHPPAHCSPLAQVRGVTWCPSGPGFRYGDPSGIRTRVTAVRGRRTRPLYDGAVTTTVRVCHTGEGDQDARSGARDAVALAVALMSVAVLSGCSIFDALYDQGPPRDDDGNITDIKVVPATDAAGGRLLLVPRRRHTGRTSRPSRAPTSTATS